MMKRWIILAAAGAALGLAGCDEPDDTRMETLPPPIEEAAEPATTEQTPPAAETDAPAIDTLPPPEPSTSEQSVKPESETLFY